MRGCRQGRTAVRCGGCPGCAGRGWPGTESDGLFLLDPIYGWEQRSVAERVVVGGTYSLTDVQCFATVGLQEAIVAGSGARFVAAAFVGRSLVARRQLGAAGPEGYLFSELSAEGLSSWAAGSVALSLASGLYFAALTQMDWGAVPPVWLKTQIFAFIISECAEASTLAVDEAVKGVGRWLTGADA